MSTVVLCVLMVFGGALAVSLWRSIPDSLLFGRRREAAVLAALAFALAVFAAWCGASAVGTVVCP